MTTSNKAVTNKPRLATARGTAYSAVAAVSPARMTARRGHLTPPLVGKAGARLSARPASPPPPSAAAVAPSLLGASAVGGAAGVAVADSVFVVHAFSDGEASRRSPENEEKRPANTGDRNRDGEQGRPRSPPALPAPPSESASSRDGPDGGRPPRGVAPEPARGERKTTTVSLARGRRSSSDSCLVEAVVAEGAEAHVLGSTTLSRASTALVFPSRAGRCGARSSWSSSTDSDASPSGGPSVSPTGQPTPLVCAGGVHSSPRNPAGDKGPSPPTTGMVATTRDRSCRGRSEAMLVSGGGKAAPVTVIASPRQGPGMNRVSLVGLGQVDATSGHRGGVCQATKPQRSSPCKTPLRTTVTANRHTEV